MAPALDGLPAAEVDVDVSGPVAEFLRSLSPRMLGRIRLALRLFEWLPFPWRFSRLDLGAREDFLRRMEDSRFSLYHELVLMAKTFGTLGYAVDPGVEGALGIETSCALADGSLPEPAGSLGDLTPAGEGEECDVVIVGSGAGGAAAAAALAEAGLDVIVLEAGSHYNRDNYPDDQLDAIASIYRDAGLTIAEGSPAIPVPVGRTVGGTTVINSGTCFRAPEQVLKHWLEGHGVEWASDLDPDFAEAEEFLRVRRSTPSGWAATASWRWKGPRRWASAAARSPATPAPASSAAPAPTAAGSTPSAGCTSATCRGRSPPGPGCGPGSRRTGSWSRTGALSASAAASPRPATGARRAYTVRARLATIVAGGALGTPELLKRSGLGGDQVGRNLHLHPACWVGARYEEEVRGWDGVMQSYYVDEWESEQVLLEATFTPLPFGGAWLRGTGREHQESLLAYDRVGSIGVQLTDQSTGRVGVSGDGSLRMTYRLSDEDAGRIAFGIARAAEIHFAAGASEVYPNIARVPVLRPGDLPTFEATTFRPSELRLEAFHPMGTARMCIGPRLPASAPPTARSVASPISTSPTPRCSRPRSGSTR